MNGFRVEKHLPKYKLIASHTARRSFATNSYLMGIDILAIMQITGHKTESAFLKYIKVEGIQYAQRVKDYWNRENENIRKVN